ncbi:MAG: YetF domain-containing protein [Sporolactobacillus sp.]
MDTSVARMLTVIIVIGFGFGRLITARISDHSFAEGLMLAAATILSVVSVATPEDPFTDYIVPILLLVAGYRCQPLLQRISRLSALLALKPLSTASGQTAFVQPPEPMALVLIDNGIVRDDNLHKIGQTPLWLRQELRKFGYRDIRQVAYLTLDKNGNFFLDLKQDIYV